MKQTRKNTWYFFELKRQDEARKSAKRTTHELVLKRIEQAKTHKQILKLCNPYIYELNQRKKQQVVMNWNKINQKTLLLSAKRRMVNLKTLYVILNLKKLPIPIKLVIRKYINFDLSDIELKFNSKLDSKDTKLTSKEEKIK